MCDFEFDLPTLKMEADFGFRGGKIPGFYVSAPGDIKRVIFNDPATIVIWWDGTKTVVKAHNEPYDAEKGLAMAIAKKYFGNKGNYFNNLRPWLEKYEEGNG